ncbi:MAG: hypothetical protein ACI4UU_02670 [Clostridia bacterium]
MSKTTRNTLIMIIIILLIFAIIFVWYQNFKTEPIDTNTVSGNVLNDANTGLDNILNNILDDENKENTENIENTENKQENQKEEDVETENQMTSKENKAINLVKEQWKREWGNLNDVSFNVSVRNDGKYLVTVYDITTTQLIQGYIVDVDAETVKER